MTNKTAALALALLCVGCSTQWEVTGGTTAQQNQDWFDCNKEVRTMGAQYRDADNMLETCMKGKGYAMRRTQQGFSLNQPL